MDSLTQATLGAAVAHACWGRRLGRRALLWGGALGTLPDLDIILYPVLDDVQRLYWHRGESHSIWFTVLGGALIAGFLWKSRWKPEMTLRRAMMGVILIFATHIAIDYFNIYGTQFFAPFSRHGFGRGNMFIIDPFYTIPLLAGVITAAISKGRIGSMVNRIGLGISCCYIVFALTSHAYAHHVFKKQLADKKIVAEKSITGATPFNALLWRHIAKTNDGILIGYFSVIADDSETEIHFDLVPQNEELIESYKDQRNVKCIKWFSQGFWMAERKNGVVTMTDLRFGEVRVRQNDPLEKWQHIFTWELTEDPDRLKQKEPEFRDFGGALKGLWKRLTGKAE